MIFSFRSMFTENLFLPLPSLCSFRGIKAANWNKNRAKCCKTLHLYYNVAWPECWTFVFCFHCPFTLLQNGRFLRKYNWTVRPNEPCANHCNHDIATFSLESQSSDFCIKVGWSLQQIGWFAMIESNWGRICCEWDLMRKSLSRLLWNLENTQNGKSNFRGVEARM